VVEKGRLPKRKWGKVGDIRDPDTEKKQKK
jgi:hypothetical protein